MQDLRRYTLQAITQAAESYQSATSGGELNEFEAVLELRYFAFRDDEGKVWLLDPRSMQWHLFDGDQWSMADTPIGSLEGDADLFWVLSPSPEELDQRMAAIFGEQDEFYGDAPTILAALISSLQKAYEQGALSASEVEEMAAEQFVVDQAGKPWVVGLRSLTWHSFDNGAWQPAGSAPKVEQLVRLMHWPDNCENCGHDLGGQAVCPECDQAQSPEVDFETDEARAAFQTFIMIGMGTIPETAAEAWDPPLSYPDLQLHTGPKCRACGAVNSVASVYCNQCAAALGCTQCGVINRLDDKFCTQCGSELPVLQFER